MAFDSSSFGKVDNSFNTGVIQLFAYNTAADAIATVIASGYFNSITNNLRQDDIIFVEASDADNIVKVTSATGAATVTVASIIDNSIIADGSVTNAKVNASAAIAFSKLAALTSANILVGNGSNVATAVAMSGDVAIDNAGATTIQAASVEKAMLATGIKPSHMIVYAGEHTSTADGGGVNAVTVTGALETDFVYCQLHTKGSTPRTILTALVSAPDTMTITFSGDPSTDHVVAYQVVRATS